MTIRFERVRLFLDYIARKEREELEISAERAGPFQEGLLPNIRTTIDAEMTPIGRKFGIKSPQA